MTIDVGDVTVAYERDRDTQAWARWLARSIDALLMTPFIIAAFFGVGVAVEMGQLPYEFIAWSENQISSTIVEVVAAFVLAALWEPLFLSNTGTTPGKWIMGVRVRTADGRNIGLFTGYQRFLWVYFVGLGFGIPLVSLVCVLIARSKLVADGVTAWDEGLNINVQHTKRHPIVWSLAAVIVLSTNIGFAILSRLPA